MVRACGARSLRERRDSTRHVPFLGCAVWVNPYSQKCEKMLVKSFLGPEVGEDKLSQAVSTKVCQSRLDVWACQCGSTPLALHLS